MCIVVNHTNSDGCCKCLDLSTRSKIRVVKQEIFGKSAQLHIYKFVMLLLSARTSAVFVILASVIMSPIFSEVWWHIMFIIFLELCSLYVRGHNSKVTDIILLFLVCLFCLQNLLDSYWAGLSGIWVICLNSTYSIECLPYFLCPSFSFNT